MLASVRSIRTTYDIQEAPCTPPLVARGLRKRYGDTRALDGFDLEVAAGTVHALLGPNGAGKTTAVRTFATLTRCDEGEVRVAGHDVRRDAARRAPGRSGWSARPPPSTRCCTAGRTWCCSPGCTGSRPATARARADELLATYGLTDAGDRKVSTYSGGMRRRLDIAASLIRRPSVLFLDEPTTGLDPRGRNEVWATVRQVVADGHHGAADHAVPRRGRPARRPDHRHGRRAGDRRGHLGRAQGPARRRPGHRHRRRRPTSTPSRARSAHPPTPRPVR